MAPLLRSSRLSECAEVQDLTDRRIATGIDEDKIEILLAGESEGFRNGQWALEFRPVRVKEQDLGRFDLFVDPYAWERSGGPELTREPQRRTDRVQEHGRA